ncbi:MAG: nitroreductase family deazaflavin-dependent oxidoreductase [Dehalococcoidia bacterium]|nr:nitroreductase family deazaflavin-dependent oxidoreductase [Dehalococcoidia bacterium]
MASYARPGFFMRTIAGRFMTTLVKAGFSPRGANILAVRGRTSGQIRQVPVNPLTVAGVTYLVAPRGDTHWVRNIRAAGEARLVRGRHARDIRVVEVADAEKPLLLREYLRRWHRETSWQFNLTEHATDAELAAAAPRHPVFRVL